jgi:hypothetical protein
MVPRKQAGHMTCTRPRAERQILLAMRASSTHDPIADMRGDPAQMTAMITITVGGIIITARTAITITTIAGIIITTTTTIITIATMTIDDVAFTESCCPRELCR